jgi:hypothetical protein
MTDSSVRVPEISTKHDGREIDCELVTRAGADFYRQHTNAHTHNLDIVSGIDTPSNGFNGIPISMSYQTAIAKGLIAGAYSLNSFGERTTAGAETNYPVWPDGVFNSPAAAGVQMSVVSTSANDSSAGTNIRTIEIHYLDANLAPLIEVVTMNGITPVLTVATNIRFIQCLHLLTAGGTYAAAGTITASNGGIVYSQISIGETRCSSSFRMVPAGKVLYINAMIGSSISGTAAARTIIKFVSNQVENNTFTNPVVLIPLNSIGLQDNAATLPTPPQQGFNAGSIVGFTHTSDKAAIISASFFGHVENV